MAEYKYRALGWQDQDIASFETADTTKNDQVALRISRYNGGIISGPTIEGSGHIKVSRDADTNIITLSDTIDLNNISMDDGDID